jgi:DNA-directed RNA polymerase subunit RPC12/RpoP
MDKRYRCVYCNNFITVTHAGDKHYMDCPKCGHREITNILMAVLEAHIDVGDDVRR